MGNNKTDIKDAPKLPDSISKKQIKKAVTGVLEKRVPSKKEEVKHANDL